MSRCLTKFNCECGITSELVYKKPSYFVPTVSTFTCSACETRYQYQINKLKSDSTKIELHTKILHLSDTLRMIRMEKSQELSDLPETP